jgi:hypothetical protein
MKPVFSAAAAFLATAAFLLSGCATAPPIVAIGPDPADPNAKVPRARYGSVTAGTADHGPVDPKPWTEQNQTVAPQAWS